MDLNAQAGKLADQVAGDAERLRVVVSSEPGGCRLLDFGIRAAGGLEAGRRLAELCLSGLGQVSLVPAAREWASPLAVQVVTDHPAAACMASQYAGWQITDEKFFAMGSGPMRALAGKEPLLERLALTQTSQVAVGVLETRKFPPPAVCQRLAQETGVAAERLTLALAPTASAAGTVQVVARSVETALHKLDELGFDIRRVRSGMGSAPLPPPAKDDLAAIGRTNDAILYGGEVTLWIDAPSDELDEVGPNVPSSSSADFGQPFAVLFARSGGDFYKLDPRLFSPAVIHLVSLASGRVHSFGQSAPEVLQRSFAGRAE